MLKIFINRFKYNKGHLRLNYNQGISNNIILLKLKEVKSIIVSEANKLRSTHRLLYVLVRLRAISTL
jgi:hypothetical protein